MITASILTKFVGPTNYKPSRVIAYNKNNKTRVTVSWDYSINHPGLSSHEAMHMHAAKSLAVKLGWSGAYVGGHLNRDGYVWVRYGTAQVYHRDPDFIVTE